MGTSLDLVLQILAWLLALWEISAALYILVLNVRHKANRHVGGLLLFFAVNGFAVGQLIGAVDAEAATLPTVYLTTAAPAIAPSLLVTTLMLFKTQWLEEDGRWLRWTLYAIILFPVLVVAVDVLLNTQLLYSRIDPRTYNGGFISASEYINGWIGTPVRVLYMYCMHLLPPLFLIYVAFVDEKVSQTQRQMARVLLGMNVTIAAVMFGTRETFGKILGLLLSQAGTAIVYTYLGFKQMSSERWAQRGQLQHRLMALLLVVTVPIIVGTSAFIVNEIDSFFDQILFEGDVARETLVLALERFKRTVWLVAGGSLALVLGLVWLTVRQTLRPVRALTAAARAIAGGDLECTAPVENDDEVGMLARAFNTMTERLRSLINELEERVTERTQALETALTETRALYRVSDALIKSSDLDAILQAVVDTVTETLRAGGVLLITLDQEAEEIINFVSNQEKGVVVVPTPYKDLMKGLTGWVLRSGQPALSLKGDRDPRESTGVWLTRCDHQIGAILVVPLRYRDETLGTLTAINRMEDPDFTERDVELMMALAGQAAAVVQNARLIEQTQVSLKETEALYRLSRSLSEPQREDVLLQKIVDLVAETLPADRVGITMLNVERRCILSRITGGPGVDKIATDVTFEEAMDGLTGWAIQERKPAISPKDQPDPRESPRVQKRRAETDSGSILVVPLFYQDEVLGTMTAINRPDQLDFTPHDAELMMTMANQAAAAIQNVQLFKQTRNALAETHALYNISRRLITSDNVESLLQAVVNGIVKTLPANRAALITVDRERERILNFVGQGNGAHYITHISYAELMEGLSGWVMRENRPAISPQGVPDLRESPQVRQRRANTDCGSVLVVPLQYQGRMLGTITAINRPDEPDFTQHDADLMMALANQATAAIQNARLFQQTQAALTRTKVLYRVARSLIAYEDLHDLLRTVSNAVAETIAAPWVTAITFDVEKRAVFEIVPAGPDARDPFSIPFAELEEGLTGWVIREQKPALSSGRKPDPRESDLVRQLRDERDIGPIIVTPLQHQDKILGTLTAMRRQGEPDFTRQDVDLMMAMTNQAAAAVQNARLFKQTQLALRETRALYRASQPLVTYKDLPHLLHSVVESIAEALPASRAMLLNLDREARTVVNMVVGGKHDEEIPVTFEELWEGLTGWVLRHERPAFSAKGERDPRESFAIQNGREYYRFGSIIVVPLRYRDNIFGTITALNMIDEPDFTQRDVELMTAMANQAAAAIENARLFEQTQSALAKTQALYDVSQSLIGFDHPSDALTKTTEAVAEALDADRVILYTLDMDVGRIVHQIKGGPDLTALSPVTFEELLESLMGWVLWEGKAALSSKGTADPREGPRVRRLRDELACGAIMVVPLRYGKKTLGTISAINRLDQRDFTEDDVERLTAMAGQIAAAVDNARLFQQTQEALARTEALYRVARSAIALERLPEKLQIMADQVAAALPADRVLLITLDLEHQQVLHHVTGGKGEKIIKAPFQELIQGLTGWVIRERKPALSSNGVPDPREGPEARKTRAKTQAGGILVVPLIYQEEILGTLTAINRPDQRDFDQADADLMLAIANQAAVAIQNARLVEGLEAEVAARTAEIRVEKEKTEAILQSVGDAIAMVDVSLRIRYVNRAFLELTHYRAEEILDRRATILLEDSRAELRQLWPSIRRALALREIWHGETVIRRADGSTYDAALTMAAMRDDAGQLIGYVTSHRNITQFKQLEKARREFLVNVSHQLRTPVTTVQLYLQLLQQNPDSDKTARYLQNASQEMSELVHLIEDMLMVTKLDSGNALTVWEEISLADVAQDVITQYLPTAEEKQISLNLSLSNGSLPVVYGDPVQLHKAVAELVENAVIFTPARGHVTVDVGLADCEELRWAQLIVKDDGPGIVSGEQEHIFERFYRGHLADSGHIPGSGLGLVIAKGIIEAHGGELRLLGGDGEGSNFSICLPVKVSD